MDLRFNQLDALQWLWAVPVVALLAGIAIHRKRRALRVFATAALHRHLVPDERFRRNVWRSVLVTLALVLLVGALIDPRWGVTYRHVPQSGVDVMIVLDVSRSMLVQDTPPNRLERAKQFAGDLVDQLAGDRVGLVAFAGTSWLKCPLTVDYRAFRLALDEVEPQTAPRGGSLLGDAIRVAAESFTDDLPDHKVIIVFTDGEDHGSFPVEAAATVVAEHAIPIYTVGIGDAETGGRVPDSTRGRQAWLVHEGRQVWSRLDARLLEDVALATGGAYVPVGTGTVDMARIYQDRIESVARREGETITVRQYHARYQWFAFAALLLLLAESWLGTPRPARRRAAPAGASAGLSRGLGPAAAALLLASIVLAGADDQPAPAMLARQAAEALEQDRYRDAIAGYEMLRERYPALAEIPYNMGVAAYRAGDLARAREYFEQARTLAADGGLKARSAYNLGTTSYRQAIEGQQDAAAGIEGIDRSMEQLAEALNDYRQALDDDRADADAKANGELTWRLMKELEALKEQLQQQQEQQQDPQQQDQQEQDQQEPQPGQDQQQEQQEQQEQPQPGQDQQESQEGAQADESQEQEQQASDQASDQEQPMSREQAERLLQRVRDREQERREQRARAEAARQPPVDKDW